MAPKNVKGKKGAVTPNNKGKKAKAPPPPPVESESEEDDSEEDDSEEEVPVPVATKLNKNAPKRKADSDDDDDSEEDDDSDDDVAMPAVKSPPKKLLKKAEESDDEDDDDEDDDDEDDDDESDEEEAVVKTNGTAKAVAQADDDSEEDDEDDDDDDEEDSDEADSDEEEEEDTKKRKKTQNNKPAKKAKTDDAEKTTLHVNNVADVADEKVKKIFEKKGISVAEIRRPRPGGRFVYVDLADPSQLDKALQLDGVKDMKVALARSGGDVNKQQKDAKSFDDKNDSTLFVKNLAETVTEDMVQEFFTGSTSVRMPKRFDGNPKGFAYVVFSSADEVATALSEKQGAELEGNALFLDKAGSKPKPTFGSPGGTEDGEKSKVLFVKNLSYTCTDDILKEAFEGCTAARIAKFPDTDKSRGFGFVDFDTADEAAAAYKSMAGQEIDGRQIYLNFAEKGGGRGGGRGRGGRGGFRGRGRGGDRGGFRGRGRGGGDRGGFRGRGRGGGGGRGKSPSAKGSIQSFEGKKKVFSD
ncbi:nucleolin-like isoform X1 [Mizuhopecten yessoensis]|uniref:nucleolin-like isoform X1 n=1 Tax=Mizuhopecten yessoensis TaxID=6573 RepID=UPI000B45E82E|nr:nucleolin-like isoform X1 [Mizuhopecten yessoensis]